MRRNGHSATGKRKLSQQSLNTAIWGICNILRRSNCSGALQYIPELTWILFLRILDDQEAHEAHQLQRDGTHFTPSVEPPYRWQDWARAFGGKRLELRTHDNGNLIGFLNNELLPYLKALRDRPNVTARQKIISEIMSSVDRVRIDTERNLIQVLDKVDQINLSEIDTTHVFALSQVYEGLLLKLGEKGNDGGQFFTPREVIRSIVRVVDPQIGETVYDPCCGTGGFLAQSYEHMVEQLAEYSSESTHILKQNTFFGREKENLIYPIALANLVLHGIDYPHIWHGNTLTGDEIYGGLFEGAPDQYDVILTNPPFGGKEGTDAQSAFRYKTSSTQILFLQHMMDNLKDGGRCGIVLDEGVLFRTNEAAFVQAKRSLLDNNDLWCIVSLPSGVFTAAGATVKTNLLFLTKGRRTERTWYYDLSDLKVNKTQPFTQEKFNEFFSLFPDRADSERSWTVTREELEARNYDLKAVNPNAKNQTDTRTLGQILEEIEMKGFEAAQAITMLRNLTI